MYVARRRRRQGRLEPRARADRQGPRGHRSIEHDRRRYLMRRAGARARRPVRRRRPSCGCSSAPASSAPTWSSRSPATTRTTSSSARSPRRSTWSSASSPAVNNPRNLQHFKLLGIKPAVSATDLILRLIEHEVPSYGLVHLLDLPEERLEIIEIEVADDASGGRPQGHRPRPARRLAGDLGAARGRRLRAQGRHRHRGRRRGAARARPRARGRHHRPVLGPNRTGCSSRCPTSTSCSSAAAWPRPTARAGCARRASTARSCPVRPRARPALQPPAVLEGPPAGQGAARGRPLPPRRVVDGAEHRPAHAHERDQARPRGQGGDAGHPRGALASTRRCSPPARTCAACGRGRRPRRHPLPAHARQLGRHPRGRRGRRARRARRRLLHRHRGRGLADPAGQAGHDGDARGRRARALVRHPGRALLPGRARGARGDVHRRRRARALRGPGGPRHRTSTPRAGARSSASSWSSAPAPSPTSASPRPPASIGDSGGVRADSYLAVESVADLWAAGDIASTTRSSTGGSCASSTGTSPSTRARRRR